eukprot:COSAG03_NODE_2636_length_2573_cov_6.286869_2_plen_192_part_00
MSRPPTFSAPDTLMIESVWRRSVLGRVPKCPGLCAKVSGFRVACRVSVGVRAGNALLHGRQLQHHGGRDGGRRARAAPNVGVRGMLRWLDARLLHAAPAWQAAQAVRVAGRSLALRARFVQCERAHEQRELLLRHARLRVQGRRQQPRRASSPLGDFPGQPFPAARCLAAAQQVECPFQPTVATQNSQSQS